MSEEDQNNQNPNEQFDYNQNDPLQAIGYSAEPGDIYYINPPQELSTYPMYIENPQKSEKKVGAFISYTLNGTDITEQMSRRYSDFYALYEKLLQRWPGVYIPRIPPKKITGNMDKKTIKTRMRLLNRFCLNLSNINYLYTSEETTIFKDKVPDVSAAISKLPELSYVDLLTKYEGSINGVNESYDILIGKAKINDFDVCLKKTLKNIETFQKSVESASEKRELEEKKYNELIQGFFEYEKNNIMSYAENNEGVLVFCNTNYSCLQEKVQKLKKEMINPFTAFKNWLEEETLDVEAMIIAIKQINELINNEEKLRQKLDSIESDLQKLEAGKKNLKDFFKKKDDVIAGKQKEKDETTEKVNSLNSIIKIVAENMENQIEEFRNEKTQSYYRSLKIFAILQRESNKVIRELWNMVRDALNDVAPNIGDSNEEYVAQPISSAENEEQQDVDED